jgi:hypothetical protein
MHLKQTDPDNRRRYVWRLVRKLEKRDGTTYLKRQGQGQGKLFIAVSALEQLMPWDPGTLSALRGDVNTLATDLRHLKKRVNDQGRRITNLEKFRSLTRDYLKETAELE